MPLCSRDHLSICLFVSFSGTYYHRKEFEGTFFFGPMFRNFATNVLIISANFLRFLWNSIILTSLLSKSLKFCETRKKFSENLTKICKICCLPWNSAKIASNSVKNGAKVLKNPRNLEWCKGKKCRAWKMLKNAALDAKIGVDTAENEPQKVSEKWVL